MAGQFEKLPNPSVLPSGSGYYTSFGGNDTFLVTSGAIYRFQSSRLTYLGVVPNSGWGCRMSPDGKHVACVDGSSVYLYKHDGNGGLSEMSFAKPVGQCRGPIFSKDGNYLLIGTTDGNGAAIYKRSGDTFTKLVISGAPFTNMGRAIAISSDNTYLAIGASTGDLNFYKRNGNTFERLNPPSVKPATGCNECAFSPDGSFLTIVHYNAPYLTIYKRSGDTFTKLANLSDLPEAGSHGCIFSKDGCYLILPILSAGQSCIYEIKGNTFTKVKTFSDAVYAYGVTCSSDGKYLVYTGPNDISIYSGSMEVLDLQRFLLKSGGYATIAGGVVKALPETTLSSALFEREGFADLGSVLPVLPNLDRQFDLLVYDTESATAGIKLDYLPHPQLVIPTEAIALPEFQCLVGAELVTAGSKGLVTVVLSVDGGLKWLSYDTDDWAEVALTAAAVKATGMSPAQLAGVTVASWEKLKAKEIRMAYLLEKSSLTDDLAVNEWRLRLMQNAVWQEGDHKVDYAYRYSNSTTLVVKLLKDGSYKVNMMAAGEKG